MKAPALVVIGLGWLVLADANVPPTAIMLDMSMLTQAAPTNSPDVVGPAREDDPDSERPSTPARREPIIDDDDQDTGGVIPLPPVSITDALEPAGNEQDMMAVDATMQADSTPFNGPQQLDGEDWQFDRACPPRALISSLVRSEVFREMTRYKVQHIYMPGGLDLDKIKAQVERAGLRDFQSALRELNRSHNTLALVYGSSDKENDPPITCVWLIGSEGLLASGQFPEDGMTVPAIWSGLKVSTRSLRHRSADGGCEPSVGSVDPDPQLAEKRQALQIAAEKLLPPAVQRALEDSDPGRLIVDPISNYRAVPFAALPLGDGWIIDKFVVSVVPGPQEILDGTRPAMARRSANAPPNSLVVGDPDLSGDPTYCWPALPGALQEADHVKVRIPSATSLTGTQATWSAVKSRLSARPRSIQFAYFATHGTYDNDNPADESFLALNGRHLRGADIRSLKLPGKPIVVMSACESGLGKSFDDGMFGLADLWREAGASQVVMSSWRVSDEGTRDLMGLFVDALADRKWRGAEFALADAMRKLKSTNPDPAVWAAFSVYGDVMP